MATLKPVTGDSTMARMLRWVARPVVWSAERLMRGEPPLLPQVNPNPRPTRDQERKRSKKVSKRSKKVSGTVSSESGIIRVLSPLVLSGGIRVFTNSATLVVETVVPTYRDRRVRYATQSAEVLTLSGTGKPLILSH